MSQSGSNAVLLISQVCIPVQSLCLCLSRSRSFSFLLCSISRFFSPVYDDTDVCVSLHSFIALYYVLISSSPWESLALAHRINRLYLSHLYNRLSVTLRPRKHPSPFRICCQQYSPLLSLLGLSFARSLSFSFFHSSPSFSLSVLLWHWCSVALQSC